MQLNHAKRLLGGVTEEAFSEKHHSSGLETARARISAPNRAKLHIKFKPHDNVCDYSHSIVPVGLGVRS